MPVLDYIGYKGRRIDVDDEGYLLHFGDWNEAIAGAMAARQGIEKLAPDMLAALHFIREHYRKYNFFPIVNAVCKNIHKPKDCLQEDFLNPLVAWKLAGLPRPGEPVLSLLVAGQSPG